MLFRSKGNVALSVTMTAVSTLLAPVMTPLMFYLYAGETIEVDYQRMFQSIIETVVAPVLIGIIANAILQRLKVRWSVAERVLAAVSMIAICFICGLIAAKSQAQILQVGPLLFVGVLLHNVFGYVLGYAGSRVAGLNRQDSRTVAIEVGLQNGGMAANIAVDVLKNPAAAIAPALFAPVMNVTGSILASLWSQSKEDPDPKASSNTAPNPQ